MFEAEVRSVTMAGPDDVSGVAAPFDRGVADPAHVIGIIARTGDDGFARGCASPALQQDRKISMAGLRVIDGARTGCWA